MGRALVFLEDDLAASSRRFEQGQREVGGWYLEAHCAQAPSAQGEAQSDGRVSNGTNVRPKPPSNAGLLRLQG